MEETQPKILQESGFELHQKTFLFDSLTIQSETVWYKEINIG